MRVVGIAGVWNGVFHNQDPMWTNLSMAFKEQFPTSFFTLEEEHNCQPWEIWRMNRLIIRVIKNHDDGQDILLVGHSMGGVIACACAKRFSRSKVIGIVTINSPHYFPNAIFSQALDARVDVG